MARVNFTASNIHDGAFGGAGAGDASGDRGGKGQPPRNVARPAHIE